MSTLQLWLRTAQNKCLIFRPGRLEYRNVMREVQNQLEKTRKVTDQNVMTKAQTRTKEDSNEMRRQERNERREDPTG